jgi:predicted MPP superfamily phosphohydrolase
MAGFLILGLFGGYLSHSLLGAWREFPGFYAVFAILGALLLSQAWLFFFFFRADSGSVLLLEKPMKRIAFHSMGLLSFLFTFSVLRDLISLPLRPSGFEGPLYGAPASIGIILLSFVAFLWGLWNARTDWATPEIPIAIRTMGSSQVRIAHISDLHLGTGPDLDQVRRILEQTMESAPDLIVLTGDILDGAPGEIAEELISLSSLNAPLGVYFVLGNHECYWNAQVSLRAVEACGIQPLINEGRTVIQGEMKIFIAGVSDPAYRHFGGPGPVVPIPPPDATLRILLAHQPQIASRVADHAYDLQLSGHTHGGQFFPWNLVVNWMYRHPKGLHRLKDLWIYVHRGTGFWGPPLRLGTRSEIVTLKVGGISS